MQLRKLLITVAVLGALWAGAVPGAAVDSSSSHRTDKALVTDGHVFHDVGNLWNHVSNFGLIGSWPGLTAPFSQAPSARWPGAGGSDYLYGAGLWVGGTVLGERLVTTGQYALEFRSTEAPGDTIFATAQGAPGGARFPWTGADDDGDGAEDEDPLDGLDNDLDGLVDEDFAAVGDQHFRCTMADNLAEIVQIYPDHTPLNLKIVQESFQWSDPLAADFIGYEYRITNEGVTDIDGLHCGVFADFDIGAQSFDDLAGSWVGEVATPWGPAPVSVGWMRDGAASGAAPGWVGFVLCGLETDAAAGVSADPLAMHSFEIFGGNAAYESGGDPTNDSERYQSLHTEGRDPDALPGQVNDYRVLLSTPEITTLAPGETVVFRMALVIGGSLEAMLASAGEAVVTALGQHFDRDGDPANGDEFHVPWLRPDEIPVPAVTGRLQAAVASDAVSLRFDVRYADGGWTAVERRATAGVPARTWSLELGSGDIVDDDPVGWPRVYDLRLKSAAGPDLVLDSVEVAGPVLQPLRIKASPNPFNPRLTVNYSLPTAGSARLEILDLRGRVVRVLFDEFRPAGDELVNWNGLDRGGRAAASGVYLVRLVTAVGFAEQRVTLLR
jgi:hypothetical protein